MSGCPFAKNNDPNYSTKKRKSKRSSRKSVKLVKTSLKKSINN